MEKIVFKRDEVSEKIPICGATSIKVSPENNATLAYIQKRTGATKTHILNKVLEHMLNYIVIEGNYDIDE